MKHKLKVIKIIVYTADLKLFNEEFSTMSLVRLFQSLITLVPKKLARHK